MPGVCPSSGIPFSVSVTTEAELKNFLDCANRSPSQSFTFGLLEHIPLTNPWWSTFALLVGRGDRQKVTVSLAGAKPGVSYTELIGPGSLGSFGIFYVLEGAELNMKYLLLREGFRDSSGGAVYNRGTVYIEWSWLRDNRAGGTLGAGGAIYNNGKMVLYRCVLYGNMATGDGGVSRSIVGLETG